VFLQYQGEKAAAEAEYRESVRLDPTNRSFREWLVAFLEKEGRRDEAEHPHPSTNKEGAGM